MNLPNSLRYSPPLLSPTSRASLPLASLFALSFAAGGCSLEGGAKDPQPASTGGTSAPAASSTGPSGTGSEPGTPDQCAGLTDGTTCDEGQRICIQGSCVDHRCGDGFRGPQEQCDDGNSSDGDSCSADCRVQMRCGDGVPQPGEECDLGTQNGVSGSGCTTTCTIQAVCGNKIKEKGEECDDGNRVGRDGCSSLCTHERCGNGITDALEECDDGNVQDRDGCSRYCTKERCGDGIFAPYRGEQCDDGNAVSGDGCSASCQLETTCGNRRVDPPNETCDDGNLVDGDGCSSTCKLESGYCGDGIAQAMETCDDGNLEPGDGCSELCQRESDVVPECEAKVDSEKLPARASLVAKAPPQAEYIYTSALFGRYKALCGACHVDANQGGFQTRGGTMEFVASEFEGHKEAILETMFTHDPLKIMPPRAEPIDELPESAPAVVLASQLQAWYEQGLNPDGFYWEGSALPAHPGYEVDQSLSGQLTNIGSCFPKKELLHYDQARSQAMDAYFAKTDEWPELLSDTDFISMDSAELSKVGVVSYATTYPLWADNAKKMRHFKLPYGKKIRFDKEKQIFDLPENTRVYKTFLKEVKDAQGKTSYRKIETRVILVRKDETRDDGTVEVKALFGTYRWNKDETQATLINTPLRDGSPFADEIFVYDVDEVAAAKARRDATPTESLADLLFDQHLVRHYAIPGSQRCVECHLGSIEENFVVGFSPLQLFRRAKGEGGVIDEAHPSELGQLQRFIDWGLFENFSDLSEIRRLEAPQSPSFWSGKDAVSPEQAAKNKKQNEKNPEAEPLPETAVASAERAPRSNEELEAQGYFLGNCAHCHNPRGYPSMREPSLRQRLNMHPLADGGGIFEFRLDNMSPRNERAGQKRVKIPYITPSITDVYESAGGKENSRPGGYPGFSRKRLESSEIVAPWRSLIYRNTDTTYTYVFHDTVFPHMPAHTPGYDCRIRDLTAKWMLGIPAKLKKTAKPEGESGLGDTEADAEGASAFSESEGSSDLEPQPYVEVYPGQEGYDQAKSDAEARVAKFLSHTRSTQACIDVVPSIAKVDILASEVVKGRRKEPRTKTGGLVAVPHFNPYDMTEVPPPWQPRRFDWKSALVDKNVTCRYRDEFTVQQLDQIKTGGMDEIPPQERPCNDARFDEKILVDKILGDLRMTPEIEKMALEPIPLGLWQRKPECSFEGSKSVKDIPEQERWDWMKSLSEREQSEPIYFESPGSLLFKSVCAQCHGRKGDSKGIMASLLNDLTGGESRVANFSIGMFGPENKPGEYIGARFGKEAKALGITADDLAARYMTWMSLGGTRVRIHSGVLSLVNATRTMGQSRKQLPPSEDGNMLNVAKMICSSLLLGRREDVRYQMGTTVAYNLKKGLFPEINPEIATEAGTYRALPLIGNIADAELWQRICTYNNPMPIRVLAPRHGSTTWQVNKTTAKVAHGGVLYARRTALISRSEGMGLEMLTHDGRGKNARVEKMTENTMRPMCVMTPKDSFREAADKSLESLKFQGKRVPYCPKEWSSRVENRLHLWQGEDEPSLVQRRDIREWAMRGAANAGMMVYAFTKELMAGKVSLETDYDRCEDRPKPEEGKKDGLAMLR